MTSDEKGEAAKLQQHLALLKEEFVKLQSHCSELERKYAVARASAGEAGEGGFVSALLLNVAGLFNRDLFSDMEVKLTDCSVPAHRLVLASRGDKWGSLSDCKELDWSKWPSDVALAVLKWLYTDEADLSRGDTFTLDLMRMSNDFKLEGLVSKCEKALMASVNVKNCIRFYITADEINADALKEHCSGLISAHWDDFTSEDFANMSARLLYSMFKAKTGFPLHAAVRLNREDVVFLYLVENTADLPARLNAADARGELPLALALAGGRRALAATLCDHGAHPDARDGAGDTALLGAARRLDAAAAAFLLQRGAAADAAARGGAGDTALHAAAAAAPPADAAPLARLLLRAGADPNLRNRRGLAPLHLAVLARNGAVLELLLAHAAPRADVDARSGDGHAPLWYALLAGGEGRAHAERLLAAGAAPNPAYPPPARPAGDRLLHRLARDALEDAALFVAQRAPPADLAPANARGETALHVACARGLARLVACLLERGVPAGAQTLSAAPPGQREDGEQEGEREEGAEEEQEEEGGPGAETALHVAVRRRQEAAVRALVAFVRGDAARAAAAQLDARDAAGDTALAAALASGQPHLLPLLLEGGADVDVRDARGQSLLHRALRAGDGARALLLLEHGADPHAPAPPEEGGEEQEAATPLQLAVRARLPAAVEALCRRGAALSAPEGSRAAPPLWEALAGGQLDVAAALVRHGADPDCWAADARGRLGTLLHRALDARDERAAQFLVRSGCDLNSPRRGGAREGGAEAGEEEREEEGAAPLHVCCARGLAVAARALVEHGADVNQRDAAGRTPLHAAVRARQAEAAALLLAHPGLDAAARDRAGQTPFAAALAARDPRAAEAILRRHPAAADQTDARGRNFLHAAIARGDVEGALFLLGARADANARVRDAEQAPALLLAAAAGDEVLVRSLLLAGARVDASDARGRTALHAAAAEGHAAAVAALLQNGAPCDARDAAGQSALHAAARAGRVAAARALLLESEADARALDARGRSPLHALAAAPAAAAAGDAAAALAQLLLERDPPAPLDRADADGNTPLLLAYMQGHGALCRALVRAGAGLGAVNRDGVSLFNHQVPTKQLLYRLLDHLSQEPPWAEGDACLECGSKFGLTMRKHHCRHCGRILCSKCSGRDVPILKFNLNKPVRVCSVCFDVLQVGST